MKLSVIKKLGGFPAFVRSLDRVSDEIWYKPLGEGKWSIHDIIVHIMKWDEYFNQVTFPILRDGKSSDLRENPDYMAFNERSVLYGKGKTREEIVEETLRNRQRMVGSLDTLGEHQFSTVYPDESEFTLGSYLNRFFISHDRHHMEQIQDFLNK